MNKAKPITRFRAAKRGDLRLLVVPTILALFGLVMIRSASVNIALEEFGDPDVYVKRQAIAFVLGLFGFFVLQAISYENWKKLASPLFFVTLGLLLLVLIFPAGDGVKSWAVILGVRFQTSELAKLSFVLFFSAWLAKRKDKMHHLTTFISFIVLIGIITVLVMMQPDFGTLSIMVAIAFTMYAVAGAPWWHALSFLGVGGVGAAYYIMSAQYRMARIFSFINPSLDAEGAGYHVRNIFISVGSASWWGLGLGNSKQKRLFLPEPHNDSIFAVIAEELGFIRSSVVLVVVFYLIYSIVSLAKKVVDPYAKNVVTGISAWIFFQAVLNIGAMIGLLPLTGVPLPFISYGGTSLVVLLSAMGILLNISKEARE